MQTLDTIPATPARANLLALIADCLADPAPTFDVRHARRACFEQYAAQIEGSETLIADAYRLPLNDSAERTFNELVGSWLRTIIATGTAPDDLAELVANTTEAHRIRTERRAASEARHAAAQAAIFRAEREENIGSRFD